MSDLVDELTVFDKLPDYLKYDINHYHVFEENCALFVTNEDKVYGLGYDQPRTMVSSRTVPNELVEIVELSGKGVVRFFPTAHFVMAMTSDKRVYAWGRNYLGQLGRGFTSTYEECLLPKEIEFGDSAVRELSLNHDTILSLMNNGKVLAWGWNYHGYIGKKLDKNVAKPIELKFLAKLRVKRVYCLGYDYYFIITEDNKVYSWGDNNKYNLGHDSDDGKIFVPKLIDKLSSLNIIDIKYSDFGNERITYFLTSDGKIYFCGKLCTNDTENYQKYPIQIECDELFVGLESVFYMWQMTVALTDKQVVFEIISNKAIETEFKSFEQYFVRHQITHKTYTLFP